MKELGVRVDYVDAVVVGGGAAGLRAALEMARRDPVRTVALVSKVYPMRSHTVAAEGGAAGVAGADDDADQHVADTLAGGAGLSSEPVVRFVVEHAPGELAQLERWGMPWSRDAQGRPEIRRFGGMSRARTWFAADRTGFHMLHTLFQTSLQFDAIRRYDEHHVLELLVDDGRVRGVLAHDQHTGEPLVIAAGAVVLATGGAARMYQHSSNAGICNGDGMSMALRAGVALRDMEFVQFHPTCLPGTGILITEAARGEGGVLLDANGERYLADYGLGPVTPVGEPVPLRMELGPRDQLSQAFWKAERDGRTISGPEGSVVHLDLRHLGKAVLRERLPLVSALANQFVGTDPARDPVPVRPAAHYTMGGILTDVTGSTSVHGLFAAGECASTGLHGANRLGSNSLVETLVMGAAAGRAVVSQLSDDGAGSAGAVEPLTSAVLDQAGAAADRWLSMMGRGTESPAQIRNELGAVLENAAGIYRDGTELTAAVAALDDLAARYTDVQVTDTSRVLNTDWVGAIELGAMLDVASVTVAAALARTESRGAHQRLDHPDAAAEPQHSVGRMAGGRIDVGHMPVGGTVADAAQVRSGL